MMQSIANFFAGVRSLWRARSIRTPSVQEDEHMYPYRMSCSALFIDWLSMTIHVSSASRDEVLDRLMELAMAGDIEREANPYSELLKTYRYAFHLYFGAGCSCRIQVQPHAPGSRYMRIEWNPSRAVKFRRNPMDDIVRILRICIPGYSASVLLTANITRIDLSLDIRGVHIESLLVFTTTRKSVSERYFASHSLHDKMGRLNSMEIGSPKSRQYLLIYDKRLQADTAQFEVSPEQDVSSGASQGRIKTPLTRFELRLRSVGNMERLFALDNPFSAYTVTSFDIPEEVAGRAHITQWLLDSCKFRGAQAALSLIFDRRERTRFRDFLKESAPPAWWRPDTIWSQMPSAFAQALNLDVSDQS